MKKIGGFYGLEKATMESVQALVVEQQRTNDLLLALLTQHSAATVGVWSPGEKDLVSRVLAGQRA